MITIPLDDKNQLPDHTFWVYEKVTPDVAADKYHESQGRVAKVIYTVTWPGGRVDCFIPWESE